MPATCSRLACLMLSLLGLACHPAAQPTGSTFPVDTFAQARLHPRDSLRQALRQDRRLLIVYDSPDPQVQAAMATALQALAQGNRYTQAEVIPAANWDPQAEGPAACLLVGTPASFPLLTHPGLPLRVQAGALYLGDTRLDGPGLTAYVHLVPHPEQPGQGLSYLTALTDSSILAYLQSPQAARLLRERWAFQVFQGSQRLWLGDTRPDGQPDPARTWDLRLPAQPRQQDAAIAWYGPALSPARQAALVRTLAALQAWLPPAPGSPPLPVYVHPTAEQMGLATQRMENGFVDTLTGQVHLLEQAGLTTYPSEALAWAYLRQQWGPAALPILEEGLAIAFTPGWQRQGYAYWAGRLYAAQASVPLATLCATASPEQGLPRQALAGALAGFLLDRWSPAVLAAHYRTGLADSLARLEPAWQQWLAHLAQTHPPTPRRYLPEGYWATGMTLAHEGYQVVDGYGGQAVAHELTRLRALGTNSIALVPYTGTRELHQPRAFAIWQQAGGENDLALLNSYYLARAQGLRTLLKPQIWFPGSWPGELEMTNEADWQAFFQHYRRWITHYALLAEIHEMDLFCAGVEFVQATRQQPEAWRRLIEDLRSLYRGPITYAANWGEEVEHLAFADALDYVGVNCYYPLGRGATLSDAALEQGVARVMGRLAQLATEFDRPLILTEVGFRSVPAPWEAPHAEAGDRPYAGQDQARCYAALLAGIAEADWCRGVYWWKWPTYAGYSAQNPPGFTPAGKPAEAVLGAWFPGLARD